jgi:hypothetical protein
VTPDQLKNVAWYVAYAAAGALVATGVQFGVVLVGTGDIEWRPLAATFVTALFGALATAFGTSTLTRVGSEHIAQQVNALREMGYHRDDLTVRPRGGSAPDPVATDGSPVVLTPDQVKQVADELEQRMRATANRPPEPPPVPDIDWNKG